MKSTKNDTANRLFNVALTRTQGKFILVANKDFMHHKKISRKLMFTMALNELERFKLKIAGEDLFEQLGTTEDETLNVFLGDREEVDSWERYINDLNAVQKEISTFLFLFSKTKHRSFGAER